MSDRSNLSVFDRSGLVALSELDCSEQKELFSILENEQNTFLEKEPGFRSAEYQWPRDSLHDFSRVWEYPFVYHHLTNYIKSSPQSSKLVVVDVGSGVTFFPFSLAKSGYQVVCTDIDPICRGDLASASEFVHHSPGKVEFRLIDGNSLPFRDSECDAVYSISVLEHVPDFETTVKEMHRILKPGGLCLITCDINLDPNDSRQLGVDDYARLISVIDSHFVPVYPDRTAHPGDLLTTRNSPYKRAAPGVFKMARHLIKQRLIKPLIGRQPDSMSHLHPNVGVLGLVLTKSD